MKKLSKKAIAARRMNAKKSTGPRTKEGKSRVSRNALSHSLTISVSRMPSQSFCIKKLADQIVQHSMSIPSFCSEEYQDNRIEENFRIINATDCNFSEAFHLLTDAALKLAIAQLDLERVREFRVSALQSEIKKMYKPKASEIKATIKAVEHLSDRDRAADIVIRSSLKRPVFSNPPIPKKYKSLADLLGRIERYERGAMKRRRDAARLFDKAISQAQSKGSL